PRTKPSSGSLTLKPGLNTRYQRFARVGVSLLGTAGPIDYDYQPNLISRSGAPLRRGLPAIVVALMLLSLFAPSGGAQHIQDNEQTPTERLADSAKSNGWLEHAHDVQHTAVSSVRSQPLRQIEWQTPVDLQPQLSFGELLIHYGSPLVTPKNTVIV